MFKDNLKKLRKARHLSQGQLADKVNISQQTISYYESGTRTPDSDNLTKLAQFFNVSTDYLLGIDKKPCFVPDNIYLLKGEMSWKEFENDIATKLNDPNWRLAFNAANLEKIAKGKLEPDYVYISSLSMYAGVNEDFFYRLNTLNDLELAREKYKSEHDNKTLVYLNYKLSNDIIQFISNEENKKYLEYAKKLKDRGINPDYIENYTLRI